MKCHNIAVPEPVPIKPVLLEIIDEQLPLNEKKKKYAIDEMATFYGHVVLRLPPYHCILNPIEMVWSQIKRKVVSQNIKSRTLNEIHNLLNDACDNVKVN